MKYIHSAISICLLSVIITIISSCGRSTDRQILDNAEALIEQDPDSTLKLISAIAPDQLSDRADNALHALLLTQARTKLDIHQPDDSLISRAVDYFEWTNDDNRLMKSLFYKAYINQSNGNLTSAIVPASRAHDLAIKLDDDYWRAKSAELLADIFYAAYNHSQAISFTKEAIEFYKRSNYDRNHLFSLCDLAILYQLNDIYDKRPVELLDSILNIASNTNDYTLTNYCRRDLIEVYAQKNDFNNLESELEKFKETNNIIPARYIAYQAQIAESRGDTANAIRLAGSADFSIGTTSDKASLLITRIRFFKSAHDYKNAYIYTDSLFRYQNTILKSILSQSIAIAQRDYYENIAKDQAKNAHRLSLALIISSISFLIIVCAGIIVYRYHIKMKNLEIEKSIDDILILSRQIEYRTTENAILANQINLNNSDISSLRSQLSAGVSDRQQLEKVIQELFREKWETLNMLSNEFFERGDSATLRTTILNDIDAELKKMRSPRRLKEIESAVNRYMDGLIDRLRLQCQFIKPDDITFLTLIYAGLSPRAICLFTGIKLKYFYNKRARLISRILDSDAPDKQLFIDKLR